MSGFFILTGFIVLIGSVIGGGIFKIQTLNQRQRDRSRTTYVLNFPADLEVERVLAWVEATSRTLHRSRFNLTANQTMVFEMLATDEGIVHRLSVPWQKEDDIIPQLRALAPGISASPEDEPVNIRWTYAVEIGETNMSLPLRIRSPKDTAASILASAQPLRTGEAILCQWVITPAPHQPMPQENATKSNQFRLRSIVAANPSKDEIKERRDKLSEPNVFGVLRVAARARTQPRAKSLADRVRTSFAAVATPHNRWYQRRVTAKAAINRAGRAASLTLWTAQLSASELAALIVWPIGSPNVSGLPQGTARQLPASGSVPRKGIVIGRSTFPGSERDVAIAFDQALMHTHVFGKTGTGKSVLLANMAKQIMEAGHGLIVMETEGNLYSSVLDYIPKNRVDDVVIMDLTDRDYPVGFNVLDQGASGVIDELIELLDYLYGQDGRGIWAAEYIYHGLKTLEDVGGLSFTDLVPLLNPQSSDEIAWADNITRRLKDDELRRWWTRHDNRGKVDQQKRADPVLSRIWQLASRKELRYVFGQRQSSFKMADVMAEGKILLINLKGVSSGTSKLVGTLMMNAIWHATKTVKKERPVYLMLDEFGDFMHLPIDTESMLAQARKHNVGLVLAHQYMSQLDARVRDAVISNARNKIILQSSADDAKQLMKGMPGNLQLTDITNLRAYEGIANIMTATGSSGPVSIGTKNSTRPTGFGPLAVIQSRTKYGRPLTDVQSEMNSREGPEVSDRPRETGDGWD